MALQTINPSSSGAGGTDAYIQSTDNYGHGETITNGYIEAGISLPSAHGSHSGFWMDNLQTSQGHGEIDFPETYGAADTLFTSTVHWWPTASSRFSQPVSAPYRWTPGTASQEYATWHSFGVLLTSSTICTYMDHKEVACITRIPEMAGPWHFQLSTVTMANSPDGYQPALMRVAYVRVWGS